MGRSKHKTQRAKLRQRKGLRSRRSKKGRQNRSRRNMRGGMDPGIEMKPMGQRKFTLLVSSDDDSLIPGDNQKKCNVTAKTVVELQDAIKTTLNIPDDIVVYVWTRSPGSDDSSDWHPLRELGDLPSRAKIKIAPEYTGRGGPLQIQAPNEDLQAELTTLQAEPAISQAELATSQAEHEALQAKYETLQAKYEALQAENARLQAELATSQAEADRLRQENTRIELDAELQAASASKGSPRAPTTRAGRDALEAPLMGASRAEPELEPEPQIQDDPGPAAATPWVLAPDKQSTIDLLRQGSERNSLFTVTYDDWLVVRKGKDKNSSVAYPNRLGSRATFVIKEVALDGNTIRLHIEQREKQDVRDKVIGWISYEDKNGVPHITCEDSTIQEELDRTVPYLRDRNEEVVAAIKERGFWSKGGA